MKNMKNILRLANMEGGDHPKEDRCTEDEEY